MFELETYPGMAGIVSVTPTRGPNARNSGSSTAMDGSEQSFDSIGDTVAFDIELSIKQGTWARRDRGLLTSLRAGANAMRFTLTDPDIMTPAEAGIVGPFQMSSSPEVIANVGDQGGVSWSNGLPWENGFTWQPAYPTISVAAASAAGTNIVYLADEFWGHSLGKGDYIGFFPFSLGCYTVDKVIAPGTYRVWPPLRTALTTGGVGRFCTQKPTIVMKPTAQSVVPPGRGLVHTATHVVSLVEVVDPYVRAWFTG